MEIREHKSIEAKTNSGWELHLEQFENGYELFIREPRVYGESGQLHGPIEADLFSFQTLADAIKKVVIKARK